MNEQPTAKVENEEKPNQHWFRRHFYRKEGHKPVLDLKRFSWWAGGLFGFFVLIAFLQDSPQPRDTAESTISDPQPAESHYSFSDLAKDLATPTTVSGAGTGGGKRCEGASFRGPKLIIRPKAPIPPATTVKAVLLDAATDGPVRARVTENLVVKGEVAVPSGSLLLGTGTSSDERLLVQFSQMIDKDGKIQTVQAQVIDPEDKMVGIKGSKLKSTALKLGGSIGLNFLGAMSEGLQEKEAANGVVYNKANIKNALLNGASRAALDQSRDMMSDVKNTKEKIKAEAGKEILVMFAGEG